MSVLVGAKLVLAALPKGLLRTELGLDKLNALLGFSPTRPLRSMVSKARLSLSLAKRLLSALGTKALSMANMFCVLTLGMVRLACGVAANVASAISAM
jgi:hypothetical protein